MRKKVVFYCPKCKKLTDYEMEIFVTETRLVEQEYIVDNVEEIDDVDKSIITFAEEKGIETGNDINTTNTEVDITIRCKECGEEIRREFWYPGVDEVLIIIDTDK